MRDRNLTPHRTQSVEVLRVIMMLGIVACHVIRQGGYDNHLGIDRICGCAVVGFMFISGYFGIRCSLGRVLKLLAMAVYCNLIVAWVGVLLHPSASYMHYFLYNWTRGSGWWFFWGYIVVVLLSPLIEAAFSTRRFDFVIPIIMLVFGWQFATAVPYLRNIIPAPNGLDGLSFVMLIGIYIFARTFNLLGWRRFMPRRMAVCVLGVSTVFVAIGFSQYSSPFALLLGMSAFSIALSVDRLPKCVGKACSWLVPSLLSVYLLHTNIQGFELIARLEDYFMGKLNTGVWLGYLLVIGIVFGAGIIIDLPRRAIVFMTRQRPKSSQSNPEKKLCELCMGH